jgi:hypothetical protein
VNSIGAMVGVAMGMLMAGLQSMVWIVGQLWHWGNIVVLGRGHVERRTRAIPKGTLNKTRNCWRDVVGHDGKYIFTPWFRATAKVEGVPLRRPRLQRRNPDREVLGNFLFRPGPGVLILALIGSRSSPLVRISFGSSHALSTRCTTASALVSKRLQLGRLSAALQR